MRSIQKWLDAYGVSHQNATNKRIHWICVPAIVFSLFGLLTAAPVPAFMPVNWVVVVGVLVLLFYLRLSVPITIGFVFIFLFLMYGNAYLLTRLGRSNLVWFSLGLFVLAWIGQFIGHKIEGAKPSFFQDLQFLLIGPAWLLHFIYKKLNIPY